MDFRNEWKHEINYLDMLMIRQRLQAVARADEHSADGKYDIRSLYFDNLYDKALREKIDGVNKREKFRIRYYNGDTSLIHLEKKSRQTGLGSKVSETITAGEVQRILDNDISWMGACSTRPLLAELYSKIQSQGLQPKTVVDYVREPFVFEAGNVRVTLDYDIRLGVNYREFLDKDAVTIPAGDAGIILEVKWDAFLPDIIRDAVQLNGRRSSSYSKYAACRIYG